MRVQKLRKQLKEQGLEAILVTRPENQRYLSGFTGGEAALLITAELKLILTDSRYYQQVAEEAPDFALVQVEGKASAALSRLVKEHGIHTLGFESTHVSFDQYQEWKKACRGVRLVPLQDAVERLRLIKDQGELAKMKKAIAVSDAALDHIRQTLRVGMTEKEVAWELESFMRTHGAESLSFDIIAGSGPNGAKPHAVLQDRPIQKGEPIVLDLGATVDGYHSDVTRTICLGKPDKKLQEIYDIVLRAQLAAEEGARVGMTGQEIDALARNVIREAGYGEQFGHSLGHGVGLAVHEGPRASPLSTTVFEPGMLCTIEPGIYIPGWGGIRIEDIVLFKKDQVVVLTQARKDLQAR
ncbi:MAG: putative peptidase [Chloroflexi bacterium ADurb.Bin180]|nr:MAG: putative peptidase [Chloroflexi bacterium ADurb.Bin180]HOU23057.1 Xaa-Pro peptidase family protein [Anaerolineae bacterium]HQJ51029.1 Xaa-Pro peptidase family protein [Anaerolineae bacterium]